MEQTITKEQMDMMKILAETNLKISDARNALFGLEEKETQYLVEREEKAVKRIAKALKASQDLVDKTGDNYAKISEFCARLCEYADFLNASQAKFQGLVELFNQRNALWEENMKIQEEDIARQKNLIKQDLKMIENKENGILESEKRLKGEAARIESRQAALEQSYRAEKDLFDKLTKK